MKQETKNSNRNERRLGKFLLFVKRANQIGNDQPSMVANYIKMNHKIERISKRIYTYVLIAHIASMVLLSLFGTILNYFFYDLGDESFYLGYLGM